MVAVAAPVAIASGASAGGGFLSSIGGLSGAGSLLSGIGSIAGGLFGGKKKRGPSLADLRAEQNRAIRDSIDVNMEQAKKYGIHPLVAWGSNPAVGGVTSPLFQEGRSTADAMDSIGQGISRAANAFTSKEQRDMEMMFAGLQLENQELQNERLRSEILLMRGAGSPPSLSAAPFMAGQGDSAVTKVLSRSVFLRDRDGKLTEVLNPDAGDNEFMMAQDWLTRTLPNDIKNMFRRSWDNIGKSGIFFGKYKPKGPVRGRDY